MALILGIESSCDETAAALVTSDRIVLAHRLAGQGGGAPSLWRRRARDCGAGACRNPGAAGRGGARRCRGWRWRISTRSQRRGAGPDRWRHGGARDGQGAGARGGQAACRGQPSGGACVVAAAERPRSRFSLSLAARVGRALPVVAGRRRRALSPARDDDRRCGGRGVRQDRQGAGARLSRRSGGRARRRAGRIRARCRCRVRYWGQASRISRSPG